MKALRLVTADEIELIELISHAEEVLDGSSFDLDTVDAIMAQIRQAPPERLRDLVTAIDDYAISVRAATARLTALVGIDQVVSARRLVASDGAFRGHGTRHARDLTVAV